jgi:hypothetical protein
MIESVTIETIITMVMKLSESTFKPFLFKVSSLLMYWGKGKLSLILHILGDPNFTCLFQTLIIHVLETLILHVFFRP